MGMPCIRAPHAVCVVLVSCTASKVRQLCKLWQAPHKAHAGDRALAVQFVREFAKLGLTRSVGGVLGLALARELTPVVTSIILAGVSQLSQHHLKLPECLGPLAGLMTALPS